MNPTQAQGPGNSVCGDSEGRLGGMGGVWTLHIPLLVLSQLVGRAGPVPVRVAVGLVDAGGFCVADAAC